MKKLILSIIAAAVIRLFGELILPQGSEGRTARRVLAAAQTITVMYPIIELLR